MKKSTAKQIESAKKTIEKLTKVIGTHTAQADKILAKFGFTYEDFELVKTQWGDGEVVLKDKSRQIESNYWNIYSIKNKLEAKRKNERELEATKKRLENLLEQAAIEDAGEKAQNDRLTSVIKVLDRELESYKNKWLDNSIASASTDYDFCLSHYDEYKKAKSDAGNAYCDYHNIGWVNEDYKTRLNSLREEYKAAEKAFSSVSWVSRWKDDKEGYLEHTKQDLIKYWNTCNERLAGKLIELSLDIDSASFHYPRIENEIDVIITDKNPSRIINARAIWAATYSSLVTEHIRYIVTTKKTTK